MKALYLDEEAVRGLVSVRETIDALDEAFRHQAEGRAFTNSRTRLRLPGAALHMMAGAIPGYFGYKAYAVAPGTAEFFFFLFDAKSAALLAMMRADTLGQTRTGAATGLATRLLSNPTSSAAALFGAGWQAESQLLAMDSARDLKTVYVLNRNPDKRDAFIRKMQPQVKARLVSATSPEDAVGSSQIVTTITNSREPVVKGDWLQAGTHINAAGGNALLRKELDDNAVLRSDRLIVDSIEQSKVEAGEFMGVIETGRRHWEDFVELRDVAAGLKPGRTNPDQITFFKSLGLALEDVAIGKLVYERAISTGAGRTLEL
jgi:ornithine cyclodeaminase/alanine dehydrogenase-like protein (mu-crystallin family)